jgi:hypothetical protein
VLSGSVPSSITKPAPVVAPELAPSMVQKPPPPAQEKKVHAAPTPGAAPQSPDKKPAVNLPPGWMSVWSKSQKRWYFFDTKTNKSVWQWPPPGA